MSIKKHSFFFYFALFAMMLLLPSCFSEGKREKISRDNEVPLYKSNPNNTPMDYDPIPLGRLIGMSQRIVMGKVIDVKDDFLVFSIAHELSEAGVSETISIKKFNPPAVLNAKTVPYHPGQEFVYFLKASEENSKKSLWNIIGFGGEGEMPIEKDFVYFEGSFIQGLPRTAYTLHNKKVTLQRYSLSEFQQAIVAYQSCFSWDLIENNKSRRERWIARRTCELSALNDFRTISWMANYLAETTKVK